MAFEGTCDSALGRAAIRYLTAQLTGAGSDAYRDAPAGERT
jgi:hypothetical protein